MRISTKAGGEESSSGDESIDGARTRTMTSEIDAIIGTSNRAGGPYTLYLSVFFYFFIIKKIIR